MARTNHGIVRLAAALALIVGSGCDRTTSADVDPSDRAKAAASASAAAAPVAAASASVRTAASVFGGEVPSAAPSQTAHAATAISRGKVPTSLSQNPPHAIKGEPRGPIDVSRDGSWLRRMSRAAITKATQNKGGSTVTIRLYFEDGYRAVLKADQKKSATNYRSEIVAYHLDRLLGCGRTAPVVGRTLPRAALRRLLEASGTDPTFLTRFDAELNEPQPDTIRGAVIAWHEKRLHSLEVPRAWPKWLGTGTGETLPTPGNQPIPKEITRQLSALEELTAFDYLLDNTDRWSGGNTLLLGPGGPMIFLDNGAGFADWRMQRKLALDADLNRLCAFPEGLVENLRALGPGVPPAQRLSKRLERSLARDPLAPLLSDEHLAALDWRLARLLAHIEACRR
ncbi:MAG: hypothetical protein R3B89_03470 [Polyangiaceae bacterium]